MSYTSISNDKIVDVLNTSRKNKQCFELICTEYVNKLFKLHALVNSRWVSRDTVRVIARELVEIKFHPDDLDRAIDHFKKQDEFPESIGQIKAAGIVKPFEESTVKIDTKFLNQLSKENESFKISFNDAVKTLGEGDNKLGLTYIAEYYESWLRSYWGDDYENCIETVDGTNADNINRKMFLKCAIFDLAEAGGNPRKAIKIMKRKITK